MRIYRAGLGRQVPKAQFCVTVFYIYYISFQMVMRIMTAVIKQSHGHVNFNWVNLTYSNVFDVHKVTSVNLPHTHKIQISSKYTEKCYTERYRAICLISKRWKLNMLYTNYIFSQAWLYGLNFISNFTKLMSIASTRNKYVVKYKTWAPQQICDKERITVQCSDAIAGNLFILMTWNWSARKSIMDPC